MDFLNSLIFLLNGTKENISKAMILANAIKSLSISTNVQFKRVPFASRQRLVGGGFAAQPRDVPITSCALDLVFSHRAAGAH